MLISVIVPVYKVEDYLSQCIDSILNQTYKNLDVILVDDGSPDNSGKLCDEYALKDKRIKVIHKLNGGLSDARNAGLLQATGDYVLFVDSDDFWIESNGLERLVSILKDKSQVDFIGFNCSYFYPNKKEYRKWVAYSDKISNISNKDFVTQELVHSGVFPMSACLKLLRRDFLIDNALFFKKGILAEDIPWFIDLLDKSSSCLFTNLYLYAYRQDREGSITNTFTIKAFDDSLNILESELSKLEQRSFNFQTKSALKSYLAYLFSVTLARLNELPKEVQNEKRKKILAYKWLLKYTENPKVKKVSLLNKFCGIFVTEKVMNLFMACK